MIFRRPPALALGLMPLLASAAFAAPSAVPTLAAGDLVPGQKAIVRTVFIGSRVDTFAAEIVGVFHGGRADGDMILARATSERVIREGVAQGMSGSPVYVDGKLVGALSSGWQFSREPLFGITPIAEMLPLLDLPAAGSDPSSAGPSGVELPAPSPHTTFRELSWDDAPFAAETATTPAGFELLRPLALPLACSGLHSAALASTRELLTPFGLSVVPGGVAPDGGPPAASLEPGSAVAVDLMRGDLQMSAIGTVTYRDGDRLLIFGHPFFQAGNVSLPLSTAEIVAIVPSQVSSFKVGMPGRQVGAATQDRRSAVAGRLGAAPRMIPLAVTVDAAGSARQSFHFESIEDRSLAPALVGIAALNSLLESGGTGAGQTLRWTLRLYRAGASPLVIEEVSAGDAAFTELVSGVSAPVRFLVNNPFERTRLDSISVVIHTQPVRRQWTLRSARLLDVAVRPGGRLRLQCTLERWRGARESRELTLAVPEEVPPGRYLVWLGGGADLTRFEAARLPGRYRPTSLDDAWSRLARARPSNALYAALVARAPEVTSDGRDYPELPFSALMLLGSPLSAGERGRRGDSVLLGEDRFAADGVLRGELQLEVNVEASAP